MCIGDNEGIREDVKIAYQGNTKTAENICEIHVISHKNQVVLSVSGIGLQ